MFDAVRFLSDFSIEYWTEGKNTQAGWVNIRCPVCHDDSNHGGFNLDSGYYHCWKCKSSSIPWVIHHLLNLSYSQALRVYASYDSDHIANLKSGTKRNLEPAKKVDLPGEPMEPRHREYLLNRGFPRGIVRKYGLLGTGRVGELAHRIVIPIFYETLLVAWQARSIKDVVSPKYLSSSIEKSVMNPKDIVYNLDNCRKRRVIVVEGVADVWRLGDNSCATFGTSFTPQQVQLISERFDEVYIVFDREEEAQKQAEELATLISGLDKVATILDLEDLAGDPGDMSADDVRDFKRYLDL